MTVQFSPVAKAKSAGLGAHFSAHRLDLVALAGFSAPIMGFDHFRMSGPTFAPHPHAGFSAVSYVFEDSIGGLRNRDSLGNDLVIEPGSMVWTQAASGVVHDEFPAAQGMEVHGLQLFVNLSRELKSSSPQVLSAASKDIPVFSTDDVQVRILAGTHAGITGPVNPAEPFEFLDVQVIRAWTTHLHAQRNALVYVLSGRAIVKAAGASRNLSEHEAVAIRTESAGKSLQVVALDEPVHVLVLSGVDPQEPVAAYGPFIMNDQKGLESAYSRYVAGEMGRLRSLSTS